MGSEQHAAVVAEGRRDGVPAAPIDHDILGFDAIDATRVALVGGKGAHLGALSRIDGIRVPPGFCVTTHAYRRVVAQAPSLEQWLERLARLEPDDRDAIRELSADVRRTFEAVAMPEAVAAAITGALTPLGPPAAYAIRSSATAEDSPTASFAGQHDTFLNVIGPDAVLEHVRRCWASLFAERAVTYRLHQGIDHRNVAMAVVVQRMVVPQASGVLFTADPVTSNRRVASVEAVFGLGEALVAGLVTPDVFNVRDGQVVAKTIADKPHALAASPAGGTRQQAVAAQRQAQPALTGAQAVALAQLGRRVEAHFGAPQDIEWCLEDDGFALVQSRPITTLFPVPQADDGAPHVYVSVGHQQMMTDPMKPLGISLWQMKARPRMYEAGGRLFVDVAERLASPAARAGVLAMLGTSDPLIGDALQAILDRGDLIAERPDTPQDGRGAPPAADAAAPLDADPALVAELIAANETSVAALKRAIRALSGAALLDFIEADIQELRRLLFDPRSHQVIMAGMEATWWLNEQLEAWLGEKNAADTLTLSLEGNVTSEMGLALLDVADAIRPHADVVALLEDAEDDTFLDELPALAGGRQARDAIQAYLDRYGMRCVGEIDITRPRWSERPTTLLPALLTNIRNFAPGEGRRRFAQGQRQAQDKEREILERLRALPDGARKADEAKRMIARVRTFGGYREYPKYGIVSRSFVYKQALLEEAERLVATGVLRATEDVFFLTFQELHDVVRTHVADQELIARRRDAFRSYEALSPPRVITSEGEVVAGAYRRDGVPAGALVGLPVSAGTVEGRARVVADLAAADVAPGDILVTAYTDPSWSPVFVAVKGLVTEVGGLMTHGAVIAREYGLPAVVGVQDATRLIADGQRIRVHGTDGYVEVLS